MKRIFICIAALLFAANVNAQNEIVFDTTNLQMLEEVVISSMSCSLFKSKIFAP